MSKPLRQIVAIVAPVVLLIAGALLALLLWRVVQIKAVGSDLLAHRYQAAIDKCDALIRQIPTDANIYLLRGIGYRRLRRYDSALADYDRTIRLGPQRSNYYFVRAIAYQTRDRKQYDLAIADLTTAIRLDSHYAKAYNLRAVLYNRLKLYDKAIADYETYLQLAPNAANSEQVRKGIVLLKQQKEKKPQP